MNDEPGLFERADALGVSIIENDYEKLLDAIHEQETQLMFLRHDVERKIAGISSRAKARGE